MFKELSVKECDEQLVKSVDNFYLSLKRISGLIGVNKIIYYFRYINSWQSQCIKVLLVTFSNMRIY